MFRRRLWNDLHGLFALPFLVHIPLVDVHDGIVTSLVGYNSIVVYAGDDID